MINKLFKIAITWILFFAGLIIALVLIHKGVIPITIVFIKKWIGEIPLEYLDTVKVSILFVTIFVVIQICYAFLFKAKKGIRLKNWFIENNKYFFKK